MAGRKKRKQGQPPANQLAARAAAAAEAALAALEAASRAEAELAAADALPHPAAPPPRDTRPGTPDGPPLLHRNLPLLQTADAELLDQLWADGKTRACLLGRLDECAALVDPAQFDKLSALLLKQGHMPKVEGPSEAPTPSLTGTGVPGRIVAQTRAGATAEDFARPAPAEPSSPRAEAPGEKASPTLSLDI